MSTGQRPVVAPMTIRVHGEINVGTADLVLDTPRARAWHVDVPSKYAQVQAVAGNGEVHLVATADTMNVNESARGTATAVVFDVPDDWMIVVDPLIRYELVVVAYLPNYATTND